MRKIIIGVLSAIIVGAIIIVGIVNNQSTEIDNADVVWPALEESGWISEKTIGDVKKAEIVLYEYADFGCSHCAEQNKVVNKLLQKYDSELAVVFRSYDIGFLNGAFAARAATAAQLQGYFNEYKDLLFENQAEWFYENGDKLNELWVEYFKQVSGGEGDVDKFQEDMKSENVKKRLKYEQRMGKKVGLRGTPLFRINGENVPVGDLVKTVEELLR